MSSPLRVLIVEDSEDSCLLILAALQNHGYDPVAQRVESAPAMRRALSEQQWDVVIADFVVPNFNALESLQVAQELAPDLPFIVVSGNLGEELAVAVMKAGAHDYVTKGNLARLVPAIEREVREAKTRRARRQAEAALEQKEALSRAVLDSLPAEIAVLGKDGTIVASNAAWDTVALSPDGSGVQHPRRGSNYLAVLRASQDEPGKDKAAAGIQGVLEGSLPSFAVEYSRRGEPETRWFVLHATPLINYGGAVVAHLDLTVMKQAEEALRHSEAQFRAVVESLGEGLLLTDGSDRVWYANSRMAELTGNVRSEMVGQAASAFIDDAAAAVAGSPRSGAPPPGLVEVQLVRKDGKTLWAEANAAPLRDPNGQIIGTVRAVTDVTERRQAREALRKSQAGLLLAQRIGHVGSWELDIATRTMNWSAETYRIFDYPRQGPRPALQQLIELLTDEDRARVLQGINDAIREGSSYRADCRILRADGSHRFLHLQGQLILDAADHPVQMVGTVQDITERKRLEEQLRQSQKMDAVGQLAGGIAHDFNNILTVIQGYTELIAYQPDLNPQTATYANHIAVSAERASRLTRQLLAFSRKQLIQLKSLDFNSLLNELSAMLQRLLGEQSRLHLNLQADLPPVLADSGMMEQALVNLIVNARDAMPKGGRVSIESSLQRIDADYCRMHLEAAPGNYVCLGVIDSGCGMEAKTLSHLFEPFFTTKDVGRGTGLGLPTVYGIVKQHQGWIQVASQPGHGSAFRLFLPVSSPVSTGLDGRLHTTLVQGGPETILLVEDEPALRQLAKCILERSGYYVLEAGSGPEALVTWQESSAQIALLLTDMVMPGGMSGRELAVRLLEQRPLLKVLYTSGYSLDFVESDLFLREGVNFLPKPYSGTSLTQAVRACLDRRG